MNLSNDNVKQFCNKSDVLYAKEQNPRTGVGGVQGISRSVGFGARASFVEH